MEQELSRRKRLSISLYMPLCLICAVSLSCKERRKPVLVFAAASLAKSFSELEEVLEKNHTNLDIQVEISGSQTACRKVTELERPADVVASADDMLLEQMLIPAQASYVIRFATTEIVLAHMAHSRFTEEVNADNWPRILLRPKVRLGLVDPDQAPLGYRTRIVWKLAEKKLGVTLKIRDLSDRLAKRVPTEYLTPHEGVLLKLLQSRAIDYAFLYRSTVEDHNLKFVPLPKEVNLGELRFAERYAAVSVAARAGLGAERRLLKGTPVTLGITILKDAPHPKGALIFVKTLLSARGQRILRRAGFNPIKPAQSKKWHLLPKELKKLTHK